MDHRELPLFRQGERGAFRHDGPDTMFEGAQAVSGKLATLRGRVLELFREQIRLTDGELLGLYIARFGPAIERSIGTRRRELVDRGFVRDSGDRKRNPDSGVNNIVWELVPSAREEQVP